MTLESDYFYRSVLSDSDDDDDGGGGDEHYEGDEFIHGASGSLLASSSGVYFKTSSGGL